MANGDLTPALANRADRVGQLLAVAAEAIRDLHHDVDHGPDLSDEGLTALYRLGDVRGLLEIAANVYPYDVTDPDA